MLSLWLKDTKEKGLSFPFFQLLDGPQLSYLLVYTCSLPCCSRIDLYDQYDAAEQVKCYIRASSWSFWIIWFEVGQLPCWQKFFWWALHVVGNWRLWANAPGVILKTDLLAPLSLQMLLQASTSLLVTSASWETLNPMYLAKAIWFQTLNTQIIQFYSF